MRSPLVWVLVAVNGLLLANFVGRYTHGDVAKAQMQPQRRVSSYMLAPLELPNGQTGVVCIIDENTGQMAAVSYNGRNALDVMPPMDLDRAAPPPASIPNNPYGGRRF
ncbi:MAG TPA: hypothetical protein VGG19_17355 [Tepidisphaeraceae bacterium]|jgi:hypothetical protein